MERLIYYVLQTTRGWNSLILHSRLIGWYFNNKRHACPLPLHWDFFFPESQWGWWLTCLSPYSLHASGLPSLSYVEDSASEYSVLLMLTDQGLWRVTPEIFYSLLLTSGKLGKYWEFGRKYKILSYLELFGTFHKTSMERASFSTLWKTQHPPTSPLPLVSGFRDGR